MSSLVHTKEGKYFLYVKGASEIILKGCSFRHRLGDKEAEPMTQEDIREIENAAENMSALALRIIAVAYIQLGSATDTDPETHTPDNNGVYPFENENLTFVGLFGIMDVLRDGVENAVRQCQRAGINVRMVTGDSMLTAVAIAKQCGILNPNDNFNGRVMEGKEFMERIEGIVCAYCRTKKCNCLSVSQSTQVPTPVTISSKDEELIPINVEKNKEKELTFSIKTPQGLKTSFKTTTVSNTKKGGTVKFKEETEIFDISTNTSATSKNNKDSVNISAKRVRVDTIKNQKEFDKIVSRLAVLARSRPEDKYALVVGLKERDHVVAVTGDGTNDAPALAKADVGFAMGISGTDLAKNSADIIITNDNFCSIVSAVVRGRNIYDSIRKFLMFQLTVNIVAVLGTFIGAILLDHAIINAVQMLWINLIMDTLASLALATEPPIANDLLKRLPYPKHDNMVSQKMLKHILAQALFQLGVIALVVLKSQWLFPDVRDTLIDKGRPLSAERNDESDATLHSTYIFNVFVTLQIFNFLNCRRLNDECNIFKNIHNSRFFIAIWIMIVVLQVLIINFAGRSFGIVSGVLMVYLGNKLAGMVSLHHNRFYFPSSVYASENLQRKPSVLVMHSAAKITKGALY